MRSAFSRLRRDIGRPFDGTPASVAAVLDHWRTETPAALAVIDREREVSYALLDIEVEQAAAALRALGIKPSDRVAVSLPNTADIVVAFLAAMRVGAIWVGVNRNQSADERAYVLLDADASAYIADDESLQALRGFTSSRAVALADWTGLCAAQPASESGSASIAVDPFAPAAIAYTSGTTGRPKGAVHSQHNLVVCAIANGLGTSPGTRHGVVLPLTILNLMTLAVVGPLAQGATVVTVDRLDAVGLAQRIRRDRIAGFAAPPTIVHDLLTNPDVDPEDLASLVALGVGASSTPPGLEDRYRKRFGRGFGTGYGLTEAPASVTRTLPDDGTPAGSCGRALPHIEVAILDDAGEEVAAGHEGEVCLRATDAGPLAGIYTPMLGYWGKPDDTQSALRGGWLHTGDIGRLDHDGYLYITDRKNDLIIRGGANVYPAEVERVLATHPFVEHCAVIGKPDERLGEIVVAFVQPCGAEVPSPDHLAEHCRAQLARYKVPAEFRIVDHLPRNAMGKVLKRELREHLT
jgi:long-chain acyl-CoA synthetase